MLETLFTYRGIEFHTNLSSMEIDLLTDALEKYERDEDYVYLPRELIPYFDFCVDRLDNAGTPKEQHPERTEHHKKRKRKKNMKSVKNRLRKRGGKK